MKWRSICSVTSKSAITPSFNGRIAVMLAGVRPRSCSSIPLKRGRGILREIRVSMLSNHHEIRAREGTSNPSLPESPERQHDPHLGSTARDKRPASRPIPPEIGRYNRF
jgi:hypothetical protein